MSYVRANPLTPIALVKGRVRIVTVQYQLNANSSRVSDMIPQMPGMIRVNEGRQAVPVDPNLVLQDCQQIEHMRVGPLLDELAQYQFSLRDISVFEIVSQWKKNDARTEGPDDESDRSHVTYSVELKFEQNNGQNTAPPIEIPQAVRSATWCSWKWAHIFHRRLGPEKKADTGVNVLLMEPNSVETEPSWDAHIVRSHLCLRQTEAGVLRVHRPKPMPSAPGERFNPSDVQQGSFKGHVKGLLTTLQRMQHGDNCAQDRPFPGCGCSV